MKDGELYRAIALGAGTVMWTQILRWRDSRLRGPTPGPPDSWRLVCRKRRHLVHEQYNVMHMSTSNSEFFEADIVLRGRQLMTVLSVNEKARVAECVWYLTDGRRTGGYPFAELQLLVASPHRRTAGNSPSN